MRVPLPLLNVDVVIFLKDIFLNVYKLHNYFKSVN